MELYLYPVGSYRETLEVRFQAEMSHWEGKESRGDINQKMEGEKDILSTIHKSQLSFEYQMTPDTELKLSEKLHLFPKLCLWIGFMCISKFNLRDKIYNLMTLKRIHILWTELISISNRNAIYIPSPCHPLVYFGWYLCVCLF